MDADQTNHAASAAARRRPVATPDSARGGAGLGAVALAPVLAAGPAQAG